MNKFKICFVLTLFIVLLLSGCTQDMTETENNQENNETEEPETIEINHRPIANFTYINEGYTVYFTSHSTDQDNDELSHYWNFGDGNISYEKNPVHIYSSDEFLRQPTLKVNDGQYEESHMENIFFRTLLTITDFSSTWTRDISSTYPEWSGNLELTITNSGTLISVISGAYLESLENTLKGDIYFNFSKIEYVTVGGDGDGMMSSEITLAVISNDTIELGPGKSITLTSNESLTDIWMKSNVEFNPGVHDVRFWIREEKNGETYRNYWLDTQIQLN